MKRNPLAARHQIIHAIRWYGDDYTFKRAVTNEFGEPTGQPSTIQVIAGLYRASRKEFIEVIGNDNATLKVKNNRGILCRFDETIKVKQGDLVIIADHWTFKVTAVEPVLIGNVVIAQDISIEEVVQEV
jgi:hypothetical protein|nr:MAG TPA: hypothetical protein [Caudoviricetes sp.]